MKPNEQDVKSMEGTEAANLRLIRSPAHLILDEHGDMLAVTAYSRLVKDFQEFMDHVWANPQKTFYLLDFLAFPVLPYGDIRYKVRYATSDMQP